MRGLNMKGSLSKKIENKFALLVSIPGNKPDLALAAMEGGADGIKLHLNVHHYASDVHFGTWQEEKNSVKDIIQKVNIPVGILPGADTIASKDEILEAKNAGIVFLDSFAHHMPVYLSEIDNLDLMIAVNQTYNSNQIKALEFLGVDIFEATLLPHEEYGKPLMLRDLALYHELSNSTKKPVIVPTQKKIRPEDIAPLKKAGVSGIVIGAVVTGHSPEELYKTTKAFRVAIDSL
jgi:putative N-acetylmannosamine-6-phosphate epimerase